MYASFYSHKKTLTCASLCFPLQISDRLFCSFGEDILESLFASIMALAAPGATDSAPATTAATKGKPTHVSSKPVQILHVLFHFAISVIYVCQ
jgi:hypothetical protein